MTSATEELLPCPFCGGAARMFHYYSGKVRVCCIGCGANTDRPFETMQEAADAWNKRAQVPDARSRYAELFGTPEQMARFIIENCCGDCHACPMPSDCPCRASYATNEDDYGTVLEWLRGDAE